MLCPPEQPGYSARNYELIKKSPRHDALLHRLKEQIDLHTPGIRVLYPTRWTVKADSLDSILQNYDVLLQLWEESLAIVKESEMRGRIIGVATYMKSFDFFFGVVLGEMLLRHSDNFSRTLQSPKLSAAEGQKFAAMTVTTLESLRSDDKFTLFWTRATTLAEQASVDEPVLPRKRRAPIRYEDGDGTCYIEPDVETRYRHIYYEALDLLVNGICDHFNQPGYNKYCQLEELLLKSAKGEDAGVELATVYERYGTDLHRRNLELQLSVFKHSLPAGCDCLSDILEHMSNFSPAQRDLMKEVYTLGSLILVMPATNGLAKGHSAVYVV